jgi:fructose-1-phosphate kinase PfkB-like protein
MSAEETEALVHAVLDNLADVVWLACCGTLPDGVPVDLYARLADAARDRGVRVAVDTSGEPLRASLAGRPDLIKPNSHELAQLVGRSLKTLGDVVEAAQEVRKLGVGAVLASLGSDGALLVDATTSCTPRPRSPGWSAPSEPGTPPWPDSSTPAARAPRHCVPRSPGARRRSSMKAPSFRRPTPTRP